MPRSMFGILAGLVRNFFLFSLILYVSDFKEYLRPHVLFIICLRWLSAKWKRRARGPRVEELWPRSWIPRALGCRRFVRWMVQVVRFHSHVRLLFCIDCLPDIFPLSHVISSWLMLVKSHSSVLLEPQDHLFSRLMVQCGFSGFDL